MAKSDLEAPIQVVACLNEKESIRVLHVDDEAGFLKVAQECLKMEGPFEVDAALSVDEALNKMKEKEYDAVVSDYQMSGKDGLEFLKHLRKKGNGIPFVIFTGRGREEVAIKALNYGADRYLNKTGDPETVYCELAHAIRQAVDRRSAQIESLKREAKLNAILESSPEAITVTDLDGNIVECNQAAVDMRGFQSKEDLIGKSALEFIAKKDHEKAIQNLKKTIEQGSVKTVEYPLLTEDGREFPGEWSASVVRDASGKPEYLVAITRDITERKKAEEALRKSEEKWRSLAENAPNIIMIVDRVGTIQFINRTAVDARPEEIVGRSVYDFIDPEHHNVVKKTIEKVFQTGERRGYEISGVGPKGGVSWYETHVGSIKRDGQVVSVALITTDITEHKKAEDALRKSESKYRTLLENLPQKIFLKDKNLVYVSCNENYARDLKIKSNEIAGKTDYDFYPKELAEKYKADDKRIMESGKTGYIEEEYVHDGKRVFVHTVKTPAKDENGNVVGVLGARTLLIFPNKVPAYLRKPEIRTILQAIRDKQITEFKPTINDEKGVFYPEIEKIIPDPLVYYQVFEILEKYGILKREFYDTTLECPSCDSNKISVKIYCPSCRSTNISKQTGIYFKCYVCGKETSWPEHKYICRDCEASYTADQLKIREIFTFVVSSAHELLINKWIEDLDNMLESAREFYRQVLPPYDSKRPKVSYSAVAKKGENIRYAEEKAQK
jgi:PAS domain S-box-containing protein